MHLKIVKYHEDELILNPKEISRNLNKVCSERSLKWEVNGIAHCNETIILALDQIAHCPYEYFFAEIKAGTIQSLEEEIQTHWQSGILLMGMINITAGEHLALYRRDK